MKMVKKLLLAMLIAAPLVAVPQQSKANWLGDIIKAILGDDKKDKKKDSTPPPASSKGNSVPLDEGVVILFAAGVALGAKTIYDRKKNQLKEAHTL